MAERRMFAKTIIDSDDFLDMPLSTQALYFHLSMRADDDGFLNNARKIMRTIGANQNDYDLLLAKAFIIQFDDGICVIKHWRINNYIRADRYKETIYKDQYNMLTVRENGRYSLVENPDETALSEVGIPVGIPVGRQVVYPGKDSIGKDSIDKYNKEKESKEKEKNSPTAQTTKRFVKPTVDEVAAYCRERNNGIDAEAFVDFYDSKGWLIGKNPMKDWKAAVRTWERKDNRTSKGAKLNNFNSHPESITQIDMSQFSKFEVDNDYDFDDNLKIGD